VTGRFKAYGKLSFAKIEQHMRVTRGVIAPGVAPDKPLPGVSMLEGMEAYSVRVKQRSYPIEYAVGELDRGIEAWSEYDIAKECFVIGLAEKGYQQLEAGRNRARFSVAHEVAHLVFHPRELMDMAKNPTLGRALRRGNHQAFQDAEWQANAGAGALLMPAAGLRELELISQLTQRHVSRVFNVSEAAARIRLEKYATHRAAMLAAWEVCTP
jgi:hypothetical protein